MPSAELTGGRYGWLALVIFAYPWQVLFEEVNAGLSAGARLRHG